MMTGSCWYANVACRRLGFALLLKFYSRHGRFPRGRSDLADGAIRFVADQIGLPASDLGFYEWSGSTIEYHRSQIRNHLGFRVATVADQDHLTVWLAEHIANAERRPDRVREALWPGSVRSGSSLRDIYRHIRIDRCAERSTAA